MTLIDYFRSYYFLINGAQEVAVRDFIESYSSHNDLELINETVVKLFIEGKGLKIIEVGSEDVIEGIRPINPMIIRRINSKLNSYTTKVNLEGQRAIEKYEYLLRQLEATKQEACKCDRSDNECYRCKSIKSLNREIYTHEDGEYNEIKEVLGVLFNHSNNEKYITEVAINHDNTAWTRAASAYILILRRDKK
jgi:hypothetical protein